MKKSIEEKMELALLEKQEKMFQGSFSSRTNKEGVPLKVGDFTKFIDERKRK